MPAVVVFDNTDLAGSLQLEVVDEKRPADRATEPASRIGRGQRAKLVAIELDESTAKPGP